MASKDALLIRLRMPVVLAICGAASIGLTRSVPAEDVTKEGRSPGEATGGEAQPSPSVRLLPVDPVDLRAGRVTLRAEVEGPSTAEVSFFVNGVLLGSDADPPYEMEWVVGDRYRDALLRVSARTPVGTAHDVASVPAPGPISATTVIDRPPDWVEFDVAFVDSSGQPILDVTEDELIVLEDGRRQEIELFEPDQRAVNVILLLDGSDSTSSFWELLASATRLFGRTLRAGDRASVAAFDRWIHQLAPLGTLAEDIPKAMERHQDLGGSTRIYDAMAQSAVFLSARSDGRRALILLTDGADSASDLRVRDVEDYLQETGTEADSILVYPQDDGSLEYQLYKHSKLDYLRKGMERISRASGGIALEIGPADLAGAFVEIGEHLRNEYRVGYSSLTRQPESEERKLEVRLRRPGIHQAHYRRVRPASTVSEFLIAEMAHPKVHRRQFALAAAAAMPGPEVRQALVAALAAGEDLDSGAPAIARTTLLQLGTVSAPFLLDASRSEDPALSHRATLVLVDLLSGLTGSGGDLLVLEETVRALGEGDLASGRAELRRLTEFDLPAAALEDLNEIIDSLPDE